MKKQSLALTLTLCMGLGAFTACTPSQMSANPTGVNQTAVQPGQTSALSLQAALANYHEVDASFSDTQRLARSGQFQTKLLGDILGGDDDDSDSSSSGSLNLGLGANVDASGSSSSSGSNGSNGSSSGSGSLGVGVGANVDASGSSSSSGNGSGSGSGSLGVGVGANVDAQGSGSSSSSGNGSSNGSGSLGVGVNAGVDANVDSSSNSGSGSSSGSTSGAISAGGSASGSTSGSTNGSGSQNGSSSNANSSLDLNLDANAMFNLVENSSSQYRDRFQSSGYLRANSDGGVDIDRDRLETDLKAKLNVDAQLDGNSDNNDSGRVWTQINADALARLSSRSYDNRSWSSDRQTMADGSVNSNFYTMFRNGSSERNVTMTDIKSDTNTAFKLEERGSNFNRTAQRRSERQLDGTLHTMTTATTSFTSGDKLEIFEDRYSNAQGSGSGNGTFRLTRADGSQQSGDLRTMLTADGSLTSFIDSDNQDLMLREDAQGRGSLSLRGTDGWDGSWTNVDFNTMLNSMTQLSSRD